MKLALVTTPPGVRSGIGDYTRHLLAHLREICDVELFVEDEEGAPFPGGLRAAPASELVPRRFDQLLYQLGNEQNHAFMVPMIRAVGGTVMQHDWVLFDLALSAWPGLARGGPKGIALALREGGIAQARTYVRNWLDRRAQRLTPVPDPDAREEEAGGGDGTLLAGWHGPEKRGRWTADRARLRIPARDVSRVGLRVRADRGRCIRVLQDGELLHELRGGTDAFRPAEPDYPLLTIETSGITVTRDQRKLGDARRLGCFVEEVVWHDTQGVHELDLEGPSAVPLIPVTVARDRFELAFNRSVVRFADSFLVHSRYVCDRILRDRNARTAIGIVHHGAERRWRDEDRRAARERLGLPPAWVEGFLVTSFGGVQPHKRIDRALSALARVRERRRDVFLVLAGGVHGYDEDPREIARGLGLEEAVRFTGYVPEEEGWDWLHAGDVALNLRGPSTGGTSGGIFQAFSLGRAVVVSDAAEQRELPEDCVVKVPLGEGEVETLADLLAGLADDPQRVARMERAVRRFVDEECHWRHVARRYVEHMEGFPPPRSTRRSLVAMRLALSRKARSREG